MLALNMPSSSPRSPELEPLAYSSFTIFLSKTSLLKIIPNPHSLADFSTVTTMLKYSNNCSFYSNVSGTIARMHGWLLFSGVQANNLTQFNLHSGRPANMNQEKNGLFYFPIFNAVQWNVGLCLFWDCHVRWDWDTVRTIASVETAEICIEAYIA